MGKYHRILDPGFNMLIPLLDKIKYVQSLKEIAIDIPQQTAITIGNETCYFGPSVIKVHFYFGHS